MPLCICAELCTLALPLMFCCIIVIFLEFNGFKVFDSVVFSLVYCCRLSYLRVYNNKGSQGRTQVYSVLWSCYVCLAET